LLQVTALYSSTRQYYMLDDLSEAMAAAKKARALFRQPQCRACMRACTPGSRATGAAA
jgi:hypothetical protein